MWSVPRDARGVTSLADSRFAPANHSAHCLGSSAHPPFLERADGTALGLATTAKAFGRAVSLRTRANRLRFVARFAEASRRNSLSGDLHAVTAFGQSAPVMRLPGASQWLRPPSGYSDVKLCGEASVRIDFGRIRRWVLVLERWRPGGSRPRRKDEGLCQTSVHIGSTSVDSSASLLCRTGLPIWEGRGQRWPKCAVKLG